MLSTYLGSCFSRDRGPQEDVKTKLGEGLKSFGTMKIIYNVTNLSLGVKWRLYGRVVVPTMKYGAETWDFRMNEKHKLSVLDMKSLHFGVCAKQPKWIDGGMGKLGADSVLEEA